MLEFSLARIGEKKPAIRPCIFPAGKSIRKLDLAAIPDVLIFSVNHGGGQQLGMGPNGPRGDGLFCLLHYFPHRPVHRRSHPTVGGSTHGRHGTTAHPTRASPAGVFTVAQYQCLMTFFAFRMDG